MTGYILVVIAFGVGSATGLYTLTFFWELQRFQVLLVLLTGPVGSLIGYAFAGWLFAKLDKRNAMLAGGVAWMLLHALPVVLYLAGLTPAPGSWSLTILLTLLYLAIGASIAQLFVGISTTIADIADENELETGIRQEGVLFGAASFAGKCTGALGSLVAGWVLIAIDWPTGKAIKSAADVDPNTLLALAVAAGPMASILAVPGLCCLLGYRLTREKTLMIQQQLRERVA